VFQASYKTTLCVAVFLLHFVRCFSNNLDSVCRNQSNYQLTYRIFKDPVAPAVGCITYVVLLNRPIDCSGTLSMPKTRYPIQEHDYFLISIDFILLFFKDFIALVTQNIWRRMIEKDVKGSGHGLN
jgi:hypothetical protein